MEMSKEAKNKIMIIITLMIFMIAVLYVYFSSANIGYKRGYGVSATEFLK